MTHDGSTGSKHPSNITTFHSILLRLLQKPSLHRFLSKPRPRKASPDAQQRQEPSHKPSLRPSVPRQTATPQRPAVSTFPSSQFASTPNFGLGSPRQAQPASLPKACLASSLRPKRLGEDVEDDGDNDDTRVDYVGRRDAGDEMLLDVEDGEVEVMHSIERETTDLPFSPKRRRIEHGEVRNEVEERRNVTAMPPPSTPIRPPLTITHDPMKAPTPRFIPPSTPSTTPATKPFRARPSFVNPSPLPSETAPPLPEAFSPHRRGQKFLPGGMAATVQQWVVETGQSAVQSRRGQGYFKGEDFVVKFRVESMKRGSGGPWLVGGRDGSGGSVRVMLIGEGRGEGLEEGRVVGVRAPTWEVEVEGGIWRVGVDWRVVL